MLIKNNQKSFFILYIKRYTNTFKMEFFLPYNFYYMLFEFSVLSVLCKKKNYLKEAFKDYVVSKFGKAIVFIQCYQQISMTI